MANFKYDLEFGEEGEGLVKNLILSDESTVEVKRDRVVSETGNIAVEICYNGAPSGLTTTYAEWWAFVLSGDDYSDEVVIFIKTEKLKKIVSKYQRLHGTVRGGDRKQSELVLLPVSEMLDAI